MRKFVLSIVLIGLWLNAQDVESSVSSSWEGVYAYSGYGGNTAGGTAIMLDIVLFVSPVGGCKVTQDGFQIMDRIICSVSDAEQSIHVLFKSYADGKVTNKYGVIVFKPNERLFSLVRTYKSKAVLTIWGSLKPDFVKSNRGTFFKMVDK